MLVNTKKHVVGVCFKLDFVEVFNWFDPVLSIFDHNKGWSHWCKGGIGLRAF